MRFIATLLVCAAVLVAAAGCDPTNKHYFTQGIGTKLYPEDVADQTELQDAYVADICRQAGLIPTSSNGADKPVSCGPEPYNGKTWWLFVQAGMNDIDRRCDAYLTWLDNVRRSRAPTLKQIGDAHTAAELIMQATGVGAAPMAVAGAAFGFAANTFMNINSRLILEVNHSTVQSVVLGSQNKFREELLGSGTNRTAVSIPSRPAAIYALRSYLRLCMPMTIETQINNTITVFERAGPDALKNEPMISANTAGVFKLDTTKPITPPPPPPTVIGNPLNEIERTIDPAQGRRLQAALCVRRPDANFGGPTSETRTKLQAFKAALEAKPTNQQVGIITNSSDLVNVTKAAHEFPFCVRAGFATPYEVGALQIYGVAAFREKLVRQLTDAKNRGADVPPDLVAKLQKAPPAGTAIDKDTRDAIAILSKHYGSPTQQIDFKFLSELQKRDVL